MLEKNLQAFFQKDISIMLENKLLRQGKLLLFSVKDFYIHFIIVTNDMTKSFELPYPFNCYKDEKNKNILILDYKLKSFTKGLSEIHERAKVIYNKEKHMKYFDSCVKIIETQ